MRTRAVALLAAIALFSLAPTPADQAIKLTADVELRGYIVQIDDMRVRNMFTRPILASDKIAIKQEIQKYAERVSLFTIMTAGGDAEENLYWFSYAQRILAASSLLGCTPSNLAEGFCVLVVPAELPTVATLRNPHTAACEQTAARSAPKCALHCNVWVGRSVCNSGIGTCSGSLLHDCCRTITAENCTTYCQGHQQICGVTNGCPNDPPDCPCDFICCP